MQETIERLNLESERIQQFEVSMNDFRKLPQIIDEFVEELEDFGPNPFKGMNEAAVTFLDLWTESLERSGRIKQCGNRQRVL